MFESLSTRIQDVFKSLRGEVRLTPEHVETALRAIRLALLEADDVGGAGQVAGEAGQAPADGLDRGQAPGGDPAAHDRRREGGRQGVRAGDDGSGGARERSARGSEGQGVRHGHRRYRGPAAY